MLIKLSPLGQLPGQFVALTAAKAGDVLTLNGIELDFSPLPEGATLPAGAIDSPWIVGPVSRIDGELHLTLRLPHGPNPSPAVAFPDPVSVTGDGPVALPFDPPATPATPEDPEELPA